jgi:hypothetical protein
MDSLTVFVEKKFRRKVGVLDLIPEELTQMCAIYWILLSNVCSNYRLQHNCLEELVLGLQTRISSN